MNNNNKKKNYFFFFYISELFTHFRRHSNENSARKGKKKESDIREKLFCLVWLAVVFAEQLVITRTTGTQGRAGVGEKRGCCVHPEATA